MATLSSPGLGSGLDVNGLVTKLMAVEQQPLTVLAKKEAGYQAKLSAFGAIKGALSALQSAAQTLASSSTFTGMSASVSDSTVLSASTSSGAAAGSYNIAVGQLAQAQILRSNTPYAATTATFTTGTIAISVGGATATNVTISASNNTLAGIRDAINTASAGITATIVNDGTTNRLVLTSNTTGLTAGAMSVTVTDSGSGGTNPLSGLASASMVQVQPPQDAQLSVNGLGITRSANTVTDAISGVTLNLVKAGTILVPLTSQLTVSRNTAATQGAVNAFVSAYNAAAKQLRDVSTYNAATNQASVLTGDSMVRGLQSQLVSLLQTGVSGVAGGISRLSDIGITLLKDGTLATDTSKLSAALSDPTNDVATLFGSAASSNKGVAVRFNDALTSILDTTSGLIAGRTNGINRSIKDIGKQRDALNLRLADIEKRYRTQFTALDTMVASMQSTSTYLTQQLASLSSLTSSK